MTGQEKCEYLKRIRADIANEHNIPGYEFKQCPNANNCIDGTCPACDAEVIALQAELNRKGVDVNLSEVDFDKLGCPDISDSVILAGAILPPEILPGKIIGPMYRDVNSKNEPSRGKVSYNSLKNSKQQETKTDQTGTEKNGLLKSVKRKK